jgi:hypothetical protein
MKGLLDKIGISIHCPECGRQAPKPIRWVQSNQKLTCPECQTLIDLETNEDSVLRLTSVVLAEIHEEWLTGRQYLNLADWNTTEKLASQTNYRKSVA